MRRIFRNKFYAPQTIKQQIFVAHNFVILNLEFVAIKIANVRKNIVCVPLWNLNISLINSCRRLTIHLNMLSKTVWMWKRFMIRCCKKYRLRSKACIRHLHVSASSKTRRYSIVWALKINLKSFQVGYCIK